MDAVSGQAVLGFIIPISYNPAVNELETNHFINHGYGWICKHCSPQEDASAIEGSGLARFMTEGEAEEKSPVLSMPALAKWTDATRRTLKCPQCSIEETINKV